MKYDMSHRKDCDDTTMAEGKSFKEMLAEFQSKLDEGDNRFRKAPPSPCRPPPPPPHRKSPSLPPPSDNAVTVRPSEQLVENGSRISETDAYNPRNSLGPKPKVAPKPLFLSELLSANSNSDISSSNTPRSDRSTCSTPTILVRPATSDCSSSEFNEGNGVRDRARQLESNGFLPRMNNETVCSPRSPSDRSISQMSVLSEVSDDFDDGGDSSASDEESTTNEKRMQRHRHDDDFDDLPLPQNDGNARMVTTTHSEIMQEMEHFFARNGNKKLNENNGHDKKQRRQSHVIEIPTDVGKLRDNRKGRHNSLFAPTTSGVSSTSADDLSRVASMTSDRSSVVTSNSGGGDSTDGASPVPDYDTGNELENQRLKNLHYAAVEFLKVERNFVQYLKEMAYLYPEYMERFGERIGRNLLAPHNNCENVVVQIKKIMLQILPFHEKLLEDINEVCLNWKSQDPNISKTIGWFADCLKCCQPFLDKKSDFLSNLLQLRNEDKEFDEATYMFETEVFKRGRKGAVIQQLDQVHQNFMRFKLLMLRYSEYLVDGSDEKMKAQEAIEKLEKVAQEVNQKMGLPKVEELTKLYYRFQCQFNVLEPGRVLIRQGDVLKQTRKEEQPRYLVLFSDFFWICRVSSSRAMTTGQFEMNRSYRIPVDHMKVTKMEQDEYVRCLEVKSKVKSAVFIFSSEKERNQWANDLMKVQCDRRLYKRRQSSAIQRHEENKLKLKKMLEEKNDIVDAAADHEDHENMRPNSIIGISRSTSRSCGSQDELSSAQVTPLDNGDTNSPTEFERDGGESRNESKKRLAVDVVKPVWLPDSISNECLMEGCSTEFNLINRRHHCRDCGWLICKYCRGQAPLAKYEFQKEPVCPECYDKQYNTYRSMLLFPTKICVVQSDGSNFVKVGKKNEQELVDPIKLFKAPVNFGFKKRNLEEKRSKSVVFSRVYLRSRKAEVVRHALLRRDDLQLVFYKAEHDSKAAQEVFIHGYFYRETSLNDGILFELVHRNQFKTEDTKDDVIAFRVDNSSSAKKWSAAFAETLEMDPTMSSK